MSGFILATISFITNTKYLFRLPDENYLLLVSAKTGLPLYTVEIVSKRSPNITNELISGFISAIDSMFKETLKSKNGIELISNQDSMILLDSTQYLVGCIIGERPTKLLQNALHSFLIDFEKKFKEDINSSLCDLVVYKSAAFLVKKHFMFFELKPNNT
jgi:hypothetical protein